MFSTSIKILNYVLSTPIVLVTKTYGAFFSKKSPEPTKSHESITSLPQEPSNSIFNRIRNMIPYYRNKLIELNFLQTIDVEINSLNQDILKSYARFQNQTITMFGYESELALHQNKINELKDLLYAREITYDKLLGITYLKELDCRSTQILQYQTEIHQRLFQEYDQHKTFYQQEMTILENHLEAQALAFETEKKEFKAHAIERENLLTTTSTANSYTLSQEIDKLTANLEQVTMDLDQVTAKTADLTTEILDKKQQCLTMEVELNKVCEERNVQGIELERTRTALTKQKQLNSALEQTYNKNNNQLVLSESKNRELVRNLQKEIDNLQTEKHQLCVELTTIQRTSQESMQIIVQKEEKITEQTTQIISITQKNVELTGLLGIVLTENKYHFLSENERLMELCFKALQTYKTSLVDRHSQIERYEDALQVSYTNVRHSQWNYDRAVNQRIACKTELDLLLKEPRPLADADPLFLVVYEQKKEEYTKSLEESSSKLREAQLSLEHEKEETNHIEREIRVLKNEWVIQHQDIEKNLAEFVKSFQNYKKIQVPQDRDLYDYLTRNVPRLLAGEPLLKDKERSFAQSIQGLLIRNQAANVIHRITGNPVSNVVTQTELQLQRLSTIRNILPKGKEADSQISLYKGNGLRQKQQVSLAGKVRQKSHIVTDHLRITENKSGSSTLPRTNSDHDQPQTSLTSNNVVENMN